jgi:hypothetical protein
MSRPRSGIAARCIDTTIRLEAVLSRASFLRMRLGNALRAYCRHVSLAHEFCFQPIFGLYKHAFEVHL